MELFLKSSWTPGKRCIFKNTVLSLASWKIWIILFFNLILLPRLQLYIYKKTKSSIYRVSKKRQIKPTFVSYFILVLNQLALVFLGFSKCGQPIMYLQNCIGIKNSEFRFEQSKWKKKHLHLILPSMFTVKSSQTKFFKNNFYFLDLISFTKTNSYNIS